MKNIIFFLLFLFVFNGFSQKIPSFDTSLMNKNIRVGEDFYRYVNEKWLIANPIPPDKSDFGTFEEIQLRTEKQLREIIENAQKQNHSQGSELQKIADFYSSGIDTALIEKLNYDPIKPFLQQIDNCKTLADVQKVAYTLQIYRFSVFFNVAVVVNRKNSNEYLLSVSQGGIRLSDKDYYLKDDKRNVEIRSEYIRCITEMFVLLDFSRKEAENIANDILALEAEFAKIQWSRLENRDVEKTHNKMKVNELQKLCPSWNWSLYFQYLGISNVSELNVSQPSFFENFDNILQKTKIESFKNLLKWRLISNTAQLLSKKFEDLHFSFFGKFLMGKTEKPVREKYILNLTDQMLGEMLAKPYVEKYFPQESKQKMLILVENLRSSLQNRIEKSSWMQPKTKEEAIKKLRKMNVKIGFPDKWNDFSSLKIARNDFLGNIFRVWEFGFRFNLNKLGKPVNKSEWMLTPQTVNAYYSPSMNEIVFPAAILQPPFFNPEADDAINYGSIGMIIGHEMTHGFDDKGKKFDENGNLRDWWTETDTKNYKERTELFIKIFDSVVAVDSVHLNGKLTVGENIADLGGWTVAYYAFLKVLEKTPQKVAKIDGFTPVQRFFLSAAQTWRENSRKEKILKLIQEDPHTISEFRINVTLFLMPEFYDAFEVLPTDKLYQKSENRPVIW